MGADQVIALVTFVAVGSGSPGPNNTLLLASGAGFGFRRTVPHVIGTAIGILMTSHRLTAAQAFQLLTHASQHSNRKLRDIAADITSTGRLTLRPTLIDELLIRVTSTTVELPAGSPPPDRGTN